MQFDRQYKPELCISKDPARLAMANVHLDVERKRLVATDGRKMVVVPCRPDDHDASGPISPDALKAARKHRGMDPTIEANGALAVPALGVTFQRPQLHGHAFPPYEQVLPESGRVGEVRIGLNARYLFELAQALGEENVELRIAGQLDPIVVLPSNGGADPAALAVLMPVRI